MKRIRIVGLLGVVMLGLLGCAAQADGSATGGSASASASPGGNGSGTCFHPFPGNSDVQSCVYPNGLYSISYLNVNQYYWHPESGDFTVAETYYKTSAPGRAAGAWPGRTISVGDSCVIDSNWTPSTTSPPSNCMDSRTGGYRGATTTEQQSVLKFWQLMTQYVPSSDR
jgi:hypothetical protein